VVLDPDGRTTARMTVIEYAVQQGLEVVCIAGTVVDAIGEVAAGRADVLLVLRSDQLRPLVQIVTDPDSRTVPPSQRRPQRVRTR
jgi:hypothetical protein